MNAITRAEQNTTLATRFIQTLIGWYPKADPDPIWTKQAVEMLTPYPREVFVVLHAAAQRELKFFPSIPALRQLVDKVLDQMNLEARRDKPEREGFSTDWRLRANRAARDAMRSLGVPEVGFMPRTHHALFLWLSDRAWEMIRETKDHPTPDHVRLAQKVPAEMLAEVRN